MDDEQEPEDLEVVVLDGDRSCAVQMRDYGALLRVSIEAPGSRCGNCGEPINRIHGESQIRVCRTCDGKPPLP